MKAIAAFLLGLSAIAYATTTTETPESGSDDSLEWDSADSNSDGGDTSYNGMVIRVFQEGDESPTIMLGTSLDNLENIYCLNFVGFFESEDYDTTVSEDATYTVVANSEISLNDADCDLQNVTATTFKIYCNNVRGAYLSLTFQFTQDDEGDYGLEYTVILGDYDFISSDIAAKLVMQQTVMDCSQALNSTTSTESETTEDTMRRLLQDTTEDTEDDDDDDDEDDPEDTTGSSEEDEEDASGSGSDESASNSVEESAGISSDDSGEFDEGNARFVLSGQAFDECDVSTNGEANTAIASKLVYQAQEQQLHIVFDHFNCDLLQDPRFLIDESKATGKDENQEDAAMAQVGSVAALVVGCVLAWAM